MPAAYDTTSRRFDDLMAEVCPGAHEEVHARIEQLAVRWRYEAMQSAGVNFRGGENAYRKDAGLAPLGSSPLDL